jgi:hypothetical protein
MGSTDAREPVDILVTPREIRLTSGSAQAHTIECDVSDF